MKINREKMARALATVPHGFPERSEHFDSMEFWDKLKWLAAADHAINALKYLQREEENASKSSTSNEGTT